MICVRQGLAFASARSGDVVVVGPEAVFWGELTLVCLRQNTA